MNKVGAGIFAGVVTLVGTSLWAAVSMNAATKDAVIKPVITIPGQTVTAASTSTTATKTALLSTTTTMSTSTAALPGVNVSGGEFGGTGGRVGYDYSYPTTAEMQAYAAQGFKLLRVPFRWERLQPTVYGPLSETDRNALKSVVSQANALGLTVILDMHNYGARLVNGTAYNVGNANLSPVALTDMWVKIMEDYRNNPQVWIGMMNEPNKQTVQMWWSINQQFINDIRAQKITNKVLVPGTKWTGAHNWVDTGNAAQAQKFVDPANNFAFEVHQYLDAWSTGTTDICEVGSAKRVAQVLSWAETYKVKMFFGEIAASGSAQCAIEYPAMLQRLKTSSAVLGWTAWGGGQRWANAYMFRLQSPVAGTTTAHMNLLLANK